MTEMDEASAVIAGGWDPRYAVALVVVTRGDIAAALIDPNGDGGDIDLDQYRRGSDGEWVDVGSHGGAGDDGWSWSPDMVAAYGRTVPGGIVRVDYLGQQEEVAASDLGWWLFIAPARDDETMVRVL